MSPNPMSVGTFLILAWSIPFAMLLAMAVFGVWYSRRQAHKPHRQTLRHRGGPHR
jgi:cytochrome c-type biogenesis protein CcmH/NrfF